MYTNTYIKVYLRIVVYRFLLLGKHIQGPRTNKNAVCEKYQLGHLHRNGYGYYGPISHPATNTSLKLQFSIGYVYELGIHFLMAIVLHVFFRGMELLQQFRGMHKTEILKSQVLGVKENMLTPTQGV
jgi:hypothetical protein